MGIYVCDRKMKKASAIFLATRLYWIPTDSMSIRNIRNWPCTQCTMHTAYKSLSSTISSHVQNESEYIRWQSMFSLSWLCIIASDSMVNIKCPMLDIRAIQIIGTEFSYACHLACWYFRPIVNCFEVWSI